MMQMRMIRILFSERITFCDYQLPKSARSINIVMCNFAECGNYAVDVWQGTGPLELLNRASNLPRYVTVAHVRCFVTTLRRFDPLISEPNGVLL
jgi:hypothetical protein